MCTHAHTQRPVCTSAPTHTHTLTHTCTHAHMQTHTHTHTHIHALSLWGMFCGQLRFVLQHLWLRKRKKKKKKKSPLRSIGPCYIWNGEHFQGNVWNKSPHAFLSAQNGQRKRPPNSRKHFRRWSWWRVTNWSLAAPSVANLTPTLSGSSTDRSVIVKSVLFSRMYLFSLSLSLFLSVCFTLCELSYFEILKILICINYGVSVCMHAFICLYVCTCACVCVWERERERSMFYACSHRGDITHMHARTHAHTHTHRSVVVHTHVSQNFNQHAEPHLSKQNKQKQNKKLKFRAASYVFTNTVFFISTQANLLHVNSK